MSFLAERLNNIKPSPTMATTAKAAELKAQGIDIISLGAGEPDFDTPPHIKNAGIQAINSGQTKYTKVDGTPELKTAVSEKFKRDNNLEYSPNQITIGCGGKHVLFNALFSTLNPGDEVIISAPYWTSYPDMVRMAEGTPVIVKASEENNFKLQPEALEAVITPKTKWFIFNSPSNPAGAAYSKNEMLALTKVIENYTQVHVIADDIYEYLIYDPAKFVTMAEVAPNLFNRILTVNGVSKSYAMTGWRIGFAGGDKTLIQAIAKVQSQSTSNPSSISQVAAIEALNGPKDFIPERTKAFKERRDIVVDMLNQIPGIQCIRPDGAFYAYPSCKHLIGKRSPSGFTITTSEDFANHLLLEGRVAVVHGGAFGLDPFFRISYATSTTHLIEACNRIEDAVASLE